MGRSPHQQGRFRARLHRRLLAVGIAGAACALAAGATTEEAARLGHLVASVSIMKPGTGFALPDELLEAERWANE